MPKKRTTTTKKTSSAKKTTRKTTTRKSRAIDEKLAQNLVELQKVHTNLITKFDNLSKQISDLLVLFESAAKSLGANPQIRDEQKDKAFLDKIDRLLDQNKVIARGLTLMEERARERMHAHQYSPQPIQTTQPNPEDQFKPSAPGKPLPKF